MTILLVVLLLVLFVVFLVLLVLDFGGVWGWLLLYAVGAYGGVGVVGGAVVPEGKDSTDISSFYTKEEQQESSTSISFNLHRTFYKFVLIN